MHQPQPFGKYLLLDRVSVGGMAEVFKAKSFGVEGFEKVVAIKRILPSMAEDAEFIQMFIDEAKIAGQLSHANICQIFELGEIEGAHFIAMEYISGKDLLQIQNRFRKLRQRMPPTMAAFVAAKLCEGMDYAHRKRDSMGRPLQIIHRDVSPQNVLVSYEGEVKIIDFGIAKAAVRSGRTQAGVLKGKFGYMSPEQVRGLHLDRRSDLFAIGTLLYECLSGERLFSNDSDFSTLEKVRNAEVEPLEQKMPDLPPALCAIVMKALAREVDDRYQWANEIQEDLQHFLNSHEPTFGAKQLADWMKGAFDTELTREKQFLDEWKKITGVTPAPQFPPGPSRSLSSLSGSDSTSGEIELTDATEVEPARLRASGGAPAENFGDEAPTELYGDGGLGRNPVTTPPRPSRTRPQAPPPPPGSPARLELGQAPTAPMPGIPAGALGVPSVLPDDGQVTTPQRSGGSQPNRLAGPPLPAPPEPGLFGPPLPPGPPTMPPTMSPLGTPRSGGTGPNPALGKRPGSTGPNPRLGISPQTVAVRATPRPSSLARDVALGALAAVVVASIVAGAYFLGTRVLTRADGPRPVARAIGSTLVVATGDGGEAEVFLGGKRQGVVGRGEPLTIDGLAPGEYEVTLRRAGAPDCVRKVAMAQTAQVVTCRFATRDEPGKLLLTVVTEGATVYVDEQEISADAAREPLLLAPGVAHQIRVVKDGLVAETFDITLAPGDVKTRVVDLQPPPEEERERRRDRDRDKTERRDRPPEEPELVGDPESAGESGYLIANSTPWARVFIDGRDTGKMTPIAPRAKIALPPGRHTVTFVVGEQKFDFPINVKPGADVQLFKQLPVKE